MQSQLLRAWKLGLSTAHGLQVLCPNYDMDAHMATLFGGEAWDLNCELGQALKLSLNIRTCFWTWVQSWFYWILSNWLASWLAPMLNAKM